MKIVGSRVISEPQDWVTEVVYSPSGSAIVGGGAFDNEAGGEMGSIVVWDAATLARRASFASADGRVGMLKFLPDGRTLLSSGYLSDGIESWDMDASQRLARLRILPDPYRRSIAGHLLTRTHIVDVATSADGALVALGCWDCTLKVVTWATGEIVELPHRKANVDFVAFTPGEGRILTGTYQRFFEWDAAGWTLRRTVACDQSEHWTHRDIDGGARIVSIASKGRLLVWDVNDWTYQEYKIRYKGPPTCLAYSPMDGLLAIGQENGSALFWDTNGRKLAGRLKLANDILKSLAFAPDRPAICAANGEAPLLVEHEYRL